MCTAAAAATSAPLAPQLYAPSPRLPARASDLIISAPAARTAAAETPGPGAYQLQDEVADRLKGGRFNKGNSKSEVEWMIYEASQKPSPASYTLPDVSDLMPGGRFSKSTAKTAEELTALEHATYPAPDKYGLDLDKATRSPVPGARFAAGKVRAAGRLAGPTHRSRCAVHVPRRRKSPAAAAALRCRP